MPRILKKGFHEFELYDVPSLKDGKTLVRVWIVSYFDKWNNEYRKAFETKPNDFPIVPEEGTHKQLNGMRFQF
jgi:hypothetical protein